MDDRLSTAKRLVRNKPETLQLVKLIFEIHLHVRIPHKSLRIVKDFKGVFPI